MTRPIEKKCKESQVYQISYDDVHVIVRDMALMCVHVSLAAATWYIDNSEKNSSSHDKPRK